MAKKTQKEFNWEKGSRLTEDLYDPVGHVRDTGFSKLADGIYADPASRKEHRAKKLARPAKLSPAGFFAEESDSGLTEEFTPSVASRLLGKDAKTFKGLGRFKKQSSEKTPPPKKSR